MDTLFHRNPEVPFAHPTESSLRAGATEASLASSSAPSESIPHLHRYLVDRRETTYFADRLSLPKTIVLGSLGS